MTDHFQEKRILVTGGAGFIGSSLVRLIVRETAHKVCVFDKLTYAGNLESLASVRQSENFEFVHGNICDRDAIEEILKGFEPDILIHLAAESHVDRSIDQPDDFINTNVHGTFVLLHQALRYISNHQTRRESFRFHHVSTDEVFGALGEDGLFVEDSPYQPNSPYAASKAASDHLVRAWHHTYGLPAVISNCSNNYGPYQYPEKLIPTIIINCLERRPIPIYGEGRNVRDWLHVEDHARALLTIAEHGFAGQSYNVGAACERRNIDIARSICRIVDELDVGSDGESSEGLITFVADRPGHDQRYAIDASKVGRDLGWSPKIGFDHGLARTVQWYIDNRDWWGRIRQAGFTGERLGLSGRL